MSTVISVSKSQNAEVISKTGYLALPEKEMQQIKGSGAKIAPSKELSNIANKNSKIIENGNIAQNPSDAPLTINNKESVIPLQPQGTIIPADARLTMTPEQMEIGKNNTLVMPKPMPNVEQATTEEIAHFYKDNIDKLLDSELGGKISLFIPLEDFKTTISNVSKGDILNHAFKHKSSKLSAKTSLTFGVSIEISVAPAARLNGHDVRTVSIKRAGYTQQKQTNSVDGGKAGFNATNMNTYRALTLTNYSITASPDRIKDFTNGRAPLPSIHDIDSFKNDEIVSEEHGYQITGSGELRLMKNFVILKAGIYGEISGEVKPVIRRMTAHKEKNEKGENHVTVTVSDVDNGSWTVKGGVIAQTNHIEKKITITGKSIKKKGGLRTKRSREVINTKTETKTEKLSKAIDENLGSTYFHITEGYTNGYANRKGVAVEINLDTTGGGAAYGKVVDKADIPLEYLKDDSSKVIVGAVEIDSSNDNSSLSMFTRLYARPKLPIFGKDAKSKMQNRYNWQYSYNTDTTHSRHLDQKAKYHIIKSSDNSILREKHELYDAEGNGVQLNNITDKTVDSTVNTKRSSLETVIKSENFDKKGTSIGNRSSFRSYRAKEASIIELLKENEEKISKGKVPLYRAIVVRTPEGQLEGRDAIDYLESHTDLSKVGVYDIAGIEDKTNGSDEVSIYFSSDDSDMEKFKEIIGEKYKPRIWKGNRQNPSKLSDEYNRIITEKKLLNDFDKGDLLNNITEKGVTIPLTLVIDVSGDQISNERIGQRLREKSLAY